MAQDDYDLEKLLEIASSGKPTGIKTENSKKVDKFIRKHGIKSGDTFIPNFIIYHFYLLNTPKNRMPKMTFFKGMARNFEPLSRKRNRGYMLDPEPFDLSQENYFKARAAMRNGRIGKG